MTDKVPVIVEVKWKDAWSNHAAMWTRKELENEPDFILSSIGYLICQDKRGINLASEYRKEDQTCRHVQHIPTAAILKVKKLK